jgi:hypothetical protein
MSKKKEKVYDEQIAPLITRIIETCKANKISFLAHFKLDGELFCTSANVARGHDSELRACLEILQVPVNLLNEGVE